VPSGIFYYASAVKLADVTDGLSNTVFFSEKRRGNGTPNPKTDALVITPQSSLNATYTTCTNINTLTALPLTSRQGMSWVMGEMCCTTYNHVSPPNTLTCAGTGFTGSMANMAMQVPPSSLHPGGVNALLGDGSVKYIKSSISLGIWRAIGTRNQGEVISADAY
jgi:prepilin-type processing-associated H-X9-DG protein